jgi:hypothetical protein
VIVVRLDPERMAGLGVDKSTAQVIRHLSAAAEEHEL